MSGNQRTRYSIPWLLWVVITLNLLIGVFSFAYNLTREDKVVYVDAVRLVSRYKGMEAARAELTLKSQQWRANLDTLKLEMERSISEYENSKGNLSEREDQLMRELVNSKQEKLLNYEQIVNEQYKKSDDDLSKKVLDEVNAYVKQYGEQHGYTVILAATHYGNIAYADKSLDITEQVLEGLNRNFQSSKP